jgi:hypothetical protein
MGIAELPFHRVLIAIAVLLAVGLALDWATTWGQCQPHADVASYLAFLGFAALMGCVCWAAASGPALLAGDRWPLVMLALGLALAVLIALVAGNAMFTHDALCTGDKWEG